MYEIDSRFVISDGIIDTEAACAAGRKERALAGAALAGILVGALRCARAAVMRALRGSLAFVRRQSTPLRRLHQPPPGR